MSPVVEELKNILENNVSPKSVEWDSSKSSGACSVLGSEKWRKDLYWYLNHKLIFFLITNVRNKLEMEYLSFVQFFYLNYLYTNQF